MGKTTSALHRARTRLAIRREDRRRVEWPSADRGSGTAVVVVNYNTWDLITQLVFTLCRVLPRGSLREIVVVDNRSTDRSGEYLQALAGAGVITLLTNRHAPRHGPGLNRGVSYLASSETPVEHVWILDSDTLVLRPDTLDAALAVHDARGAALTGQVQDHWSLTGGAVNIASALLRPRVCWRSPFLPFRDDGEPSRAFQRSVVDAGLGIADFPFFGDGYVLHLEHGTLDGVVDRGERENPLYEWARDHAASRFHGDPRGPELLARFRTAFADEVGEPEPDRLVEACLRSSRIDGLAPSP